MHGTSDLNDLKIKGQPPNIRLHKLKGDSKEEWSVTVKLPKNSTLKKLEYTCAFYRQGSTKSVNLWSIIHERSNCMIKRLLQISKTRSFFLFGTRGTGK